MPGRRETHAPGIRSDTAVVPIASWRTVMRGGTGQRTLSAFIGSANQLDWLPVGVAHGAGHHRVGIRSLEAAPRA